MRCRKRHIFGAAGYILAMLILLVGFHGCMKEDGKEASLSMELSAPQEAPPQQAGQAGPSEPSAEKESLLKAGAEEEQPAKAETDEAFAYLTDLTDGPFSRLINRDHLLDKLYVPETLVNVKENSTSSIRLKENDIIADAAAMEALNEMMAGAEAEGVNGFYLVSVYRTYAEQQKLWDRKVRNDKTYGIDPEVPLITAYPGASEHQTGLAFDITSVKNRAMSSKFADTAQGIWLNDHCHEYGFILRYPKGKEHITNIVYEPWHFRYVGKELSAYLSAHMLTLEEFYNFYESQMPSGKNIGKNMP